MLELRDEKILKTIMSETKKIVRMVISEENYESIENILLVLLMNPALQDFENHILLMEILKVIRIMPEDHLLNFKYKLQRLKTNQMKLLVETLQHILTIR